MGFFSWAKGTAQALVFAVVDSIKEVYRSVSNVYGQNISLLGGTYAYAKRFLSGYRIILGVPSIFYKKDLHRTHNILAASAQSFIVFYLGALLFYEAGFKKLWHYADQDQKGSSLESAADVGFYYLMVRTSIEMSVNCLFYNLALYKALSDDAVIKPSFPQGANNLVDKTLAGLASTAYYFSNLLVAKKVVKAMVVYELGHIPYLVQIYDGLSDTLIGGASLAEYQFGGLSTQERSVYFANNKVAHLGIGFALYTMRFLVNKLINYLTGLPIHGFKGYFVDEAIYNVIYQLFIVAAMTLPLPAEKPQPGEESGLDFFEPGRAMVIGLLNNIGEKINRSVQPKLYALLTLPEAQQYKSIESLISTTDKVVFAVSGNKLFSISNKSWSYHALGEAQIAQLLSQFKPNQVPTSLTGESLNKFLAIAKFNPNKLWKHAIRDYFNHPYWRLLLLLFVPGSVRSGEIFDKTSCCMFFEENLKTYLNILDWIMKERNSYVTAAGVGVVGVLPSAVNPKTETERASYKFLFAKGLEPQLNAMNEDLTWIGKRIHREREKAKVFVHDKRLPALLQAATEGSDGEQLREPQMLEPASPVDIFKEIDPNFIPNLIQGKVSVPSVAHQNLFPPAQPAPLAQDHSDLSEYERYTVAVISRGVKQ